MIDDLDKLLGDIPEDIKFSSGVPADFIDELDETKEKKIRVPRAPSIPREAKGVMVQFYNKAGEQITGSGVIYYVVRCNGKLHYKQEDQVTILPDTWKEGDLLPGQEEVDELLQ